MDTQEAKPTRYQFSLLSLLVFSTFIAIVCAIGTSISVFLAMMLGAGLAGRIVAGRWSGIVLGTLFGFFAYMHLAILAYLILGPNDAVWWVWATIWIAVLTGGIVGGFSSEKSSRRKM